MYVHLRVQPVTQERASVQVPGEPRHEVPPVQDETDSEELVHAQEIVDAAVAEIKSLVTSPDVTITGRVVVDNRVDEGILKVANEIKADIIVMGTRGLSALRGAIMGSVSHALIEKATCPVLIVK
jgi:nucleotide-binding universal stress UspA family protein